MRFSIIYLLIVSVCFARECPIHTDITDEQIQSLSAESLNFGTELYKLLNKKDGNAIFSPASVSMVLSMLYTGAKGQTAKELTEVLYPGVSEPEELIPAMYSNLIARLTEKPDAAYHLQTGNAIFTNEKISLKTKFLDILTMCYDGEAKSMGFSTNPDKCRREINAWVEERTNGKIKDLLPDQSITRDVMSVLVNTMYFKSPWAYRFKVKNTKRDNFFLEDGSKVEVDMLTQIPNRHFRFPIYDDNTALVFGMPYKEHDLEMFFVVPKAGLFSFESTLTGTLLSELVQKARDGRASVNLIKFPKFKFEYQSTLKKQLQALGITSLFSNRADLTNAGDKLMKVDEVHHKVFIEVNENGTEAAAATGAIVTPLSIPPAPTKQFVADKPFLFFIMHKSTEHILFMGRVMNPSR